MKVFLVILHVFVGSSVCEPLIRKVWSQGLHLEGPHWSVEEQALYWVDIMGQKIHRMDSTGNVTTRETGYGPVSPVVTIKDYPGYVLICAKTELYMFNWTAAENDSAFRLLTAIDLGLPDNRCNDGKVDPKGRFWLGTIGNEVDNMVEPDQASLYMIDHINYLNPSVKVKPVTVSNGIAWSANGRSMFYIDTPTLNIDVFDFDVNKGKISNRRTLFNFKKNNVTGLPDGMTIDTDGNLWVACFNGGQVIKIEPRTGRLKEIHKMPATKVSSVMWGGPELDKLYVTTSRFGLTPSQLMEEPDAGALFVIEGTGSMGLPEYQFVFDDAPSY